MEKKWIVLSTGVVNYAGQTELSDSVICSKISNRDIIKLENARIITSGMVPSQDGKSVNRRTLMVPIGVTIEPLTVYVQPTAYYWPSQTEKHEKDFQCYLEIFTNTWVDNADK